MFYSAFWLPGNYSCSLRWVWEAIFKTQESHLLCRDIASPSLSYTFSQDHLFTCISP